MRAKRSLLAWLLAASLPAQTFIVDANGGAGSQFTSISAAVPDGATLLVRPGAYLAFTISGKGLSILAEPSVYVLGTTTVQNAASASPVALPGLPTPMWLDLSTAFVQALGIQAAGAPVGSTTNVPNVAALRGLSLAWQALVVGPTGLTDTNPTLAIVQ